MLFKKGELKLLWPFYATYLLLGLGFMILPYLSIYFQSLGFSYLQLSIAITLIGLGQVLFEIPTGVVADVFSRKYSVIIGFVIVGVAAILVPFFSNFYIICLLMFITGMGMSFISGAEEAWIIDNLGVYKRKDLRHEMFIKLQVMINLGFIISPLLGAILTKHYSLKIVWFVLGASYLISMLILLWTREMYVPKREKFFVGLRKTLIKGKEGYRYVLKNNTVFILILAGMFGTFIYLGDTGHQPLLVQYSLPVYALGYVYAFFGLFGIIASFMTRLFTKTNIRQTILIIWLLRMVAFTSVLFIFSPHFIILAMAFLFHDFMTSLGEPLLQTYLHKHLKKDIRATLVSLKSMAVTGTAAIVSIIGGILMDIYGPQAIIGLGGILGVFTFVTYMKLKD
jgi:MFS family permease